VTTFGGLNAKAWDFEGRQWVTAFEGDFTEAKRIMARLDEEEVPNRLGFPEHQVTPFTVKIEVMRRWLPQAHQLMASSRSPGDPRRERPPS
jgi:hypothetical protein